MDLGGFQHQHSACHPAVNGKQVLVVASLVLIFGGQGICRPAEVMPLRAAADVKRPPGA